MTPFPPDPLLVKADDANPVLSPDPTLTFICPHAGPAAWAAKHTFNPAAAVHNGQVHLLFRAEDAADVANGTSRIGHAVSDDGLHFTVNPEPVLFPAHDDYAALEWPGGLEDPRVVARPAENGGGFVLTYTAYDGERARLCVATSPDLVSWTKHGPAFGDPFRDLWSKSGSIVAAPAGEERNANLTARRIAGKFWMYWGETCIYAATSDDLIRWTVVTTHHPADRTFRPGEGDRQAPGVHVPTVIAGPRMDDTNAFDRDLVEPGPPAVWTPDGIVLFYNGAAAQPGEGRMGHGFGVRPVRYAVGRMVFDPASPTHLIARDRDPRLVPDRPCETTGQVNDVCFAEGLIDFGGRWHLYYGAADARVAVAWLTPAAASKPSSDPAAR